MNKLKYLKYKKKYLMLKKKMFGGNIKYKNAAVVVITGKNYDRILLLRDKKTRKWMIPGGKIDKTDKSPFYAAKREFFEETTMRLPYSLRSIKKYDYNRHTLIYVVYTNSNLKKFKPTNETDKIYFAKISDIINGNFMRKNGNIKRYVLNSLSNMIRKGII